MPLDTVNTPLTPLFKWAGGKRKELPYITANLPDDFTKKPYTYVEPFLGGGAVFWGLRNPYRNVINDFDFDLVNFYKQMKVQDPEFLNHLEKASDLFADKTKTSEQEKLFYYWRDKDRNGKITELSLPTRAARFWIVNQLAFSGMRRFNSKGEFNVPFGRYKSLNISQLKNQEHINLLQTTTIMNGDYKNVLDISDNPDTFIFIDPPYTRVMKTYSAGNKFGDEEQEVLADKLKSLKNAKFMVVIDKSPLTQTLYKNYIRLEYDLKYGVNIRNRFDSNAQHILVMNY